MATSQNHYRANHRSLIASYAVPGGKLAMRKGDVATVLAYVAKHFHFEVEALEVARQIGDTLSDPFADPRPRCRTTRPGPRSTSTRPPTRWAHRRAGTSRARRSRRSARSSPTATAWSAGEGVVIPAARIRCISEIKEGTAAVRSLAKKIRAGHKPVLAEPKASGGSSSPSYTAVSGSTPLVKLYNKGEPVEHIQKAVGVKVDS